MFREIVKMLGWKIVVHCLFWYYHSNVLFAEVVFIVLLTLALSKLSNMERWILIVSYLARLLYIVIIFQVDVFQAVKTVRRHRPQLVQNLVCCFILFISIVIRSIERLQGIIHFILIADGIQVLLWPGPALRASLSPQRAAQTMKYNH